jgi:site-specific recombinase XerD
MANATIQQHLAVLRMFYDFLVEEGRCTRSFRQGEGRWARSLVQREHKLPAIPTEEEWCRILGETAKEPIRNRLMLAMSYDAGLRREELVPVGNVGHRSIPAHDPCPGGDHQEPEIARPAIFSDNR